MSDKIKKLRVVLNGGGTAGHIYPLVAVSRALRSQAEILGVELELLFLGSDSLSKEAALKDQIRFKKILAHKRNYFLSFFGFLQSLWHLFWFMPDMIFSKGGFAAPPVVLAAKFYFIPVVLHDSDARPGRANLFLQRFAKKVLVSFEEAAAYFPPEKTALYGNPVRKELLQADPKEALDFFGFSDKKPTILIIGGTQGSQTINSTVSLILKKLLKVTQVIHQVGEKNKEAWEKEIKDLLTEEELTSYRYFPFLAERELSLAYAISYLVVSRAGAGAIFEFAAVGIPAILIPLEGVASDHQFVNAYAYQKSGGAIVIEEANFTPELLHGKVAELLISREKLEAMSQKALGFVRVDAAEKIAEELLGLVL